MTRDLDNIFNSFSIGLDNMLKDMQAMSVTNKYPFYNMKKVKEDLYVIELAVAGFKKDQLSVEFTDNILRITGNLVGNSVRQEYLFQGITTRSFIRQFNLAPGLEVTGAEITDGILSVFVKARKETPPKKIDIKSTAKESDYGYLGEQA